jgi:hypothetical protein
MDKAIEEACCPPAADSCGTARLGVCSANSTERKMPDIDKIIDKAKSSLLPFESWERLPGESGLAYAAFRAFRDLGLERNIRKAAICYANRSEFDGRGGATTEQRQGTKPSNSTQAIEKKYRVFSDAAQAATLMVNTIPVAGTGGGL